MPKFCMCCLEPIERPKYPDNPAVAELCDGCPDYKRHERLLYLDGSRPAPPLLDPKP